MSRDTDLKGGGRLRSKDFKALRKKLIEAHQKDLAMYSNKENIRKAHIHTYTFDIPRIINNRIKEVWFGGKFVMSKVDDTFEIEIEWGNRSVTDCEQSHFMKALYEFLNGLPKSDEGYGAGMDITLEGYGTDDDYDQNNYDYESYVFGGWVRGR